MSKLKHFMSFGFLGLALSTPLLALNVTPVSALTPMNTDENDKPVDKRNNIPFAFEGKTNGFPVVIIDSGMDYTHKDLGPNLHKNSNTSSIQIGKSLVSNDIYGWDFNENDDKAFDNNYSYTPKFTALPEKDDKDYFGKLAESLIKNMVEILIAILPMGSPGHGTHVSGIVMNHCPSCSLVPVKIFGQTMISIGFLEQAIEYTHQRGYKLVNMSLGIDGELVNKFEGDEKKYMDSVIALMKKHKDILFVVAAGNDGAYIGKDKKIFPAILNLPNVITVGAVDYQGKLADFSNFSTQIVDVFAPGVEILSTWNDGGYNKLSGTSMSTPMVTGIIGEIWAKNPNLTVAEVQEQFFKRVELIPLKFKETSVIIAPAVMN